MAARRAVTGERVRQMLLDNLTPLARKLVDEDEEATVKLKLVGPAVQGALMIFHAESPFTLAHRDAMLSHLRKQRGVERARVVTRTINNLDDGFIIEVLIGNPDPDPTSPHPHSNALSQILRKDKGPGAQRSKDDDDPFAGNLPHPHAAMLAWIIVGTLPVTVWNPARGAMTTAERTAQQARVDALVPLRLPYAQVRALVCEALNYPTGPLTPLTDSTRVLVRKFERMGSDGSDFWASLGIGHASGYAFKTEERALQCDYADLGTVAEVVPPPPPPPPPEGADDDPNPNPNPNPAADFANWNIRRVHTYPGFWGLNVSTKLAPFTAALHLGEGHPGNWVPNAATIALLGIQEAPIDLIVCDPISVGELLDKVKVPPNGTVVNGSGHLRSKVISRLVHPTEERLRTAARADRGPRAPKERATLVDDFYREDKMALSTHNVDAAEYGTGGSPDAHVKSPARRPAAFPPPPESDDLPEVPRVVIQIRVSAKDLASPRECIWQAVVLLRVIEYIVRRSGVLEIIFVFEYGAVSNASYPAVRDRSVLWKAIEGDFSQIRSKHRLAFVRRRSPGNPPVGAHRRTLVLSVAPHRMDRFHLRLGDEAAKIYEGRLPNDPERNMFCSFTPDSADPTEFVELAPGSHALRVETQRLKELELNTAARASRMHIVASDMNFNAAVDRGANSLLQFNIQTVFAFVACHDYSKAVLMDRSSSVGNPAYGVDAAEAVHPMTTLRLANTNFGVHYVAEHRDDLEFTTVRLDHVSASHEDQAEAQFFEELVMVGCAAIVFLRDLSRLTRGGIEAVLRILRKLQAASATLVLMHVPHSFLANCTLSGKRPCASS
ncbi:hypothetical protein DFJ74DRAFT_655273 [Hyaloraphidium curvatum]|nr:hypothetical protein DFJ74DRAFT_655273 [Hyaloraphidium curvatum]